MVPVPVKLTVCGLVAELSNVVRVPAASPVVVGENVTDRLQLLPPARVVPQVPPTENGPVTAMLLIVNGAVPVFASVIA